MGFILSLPHSSQLSILQAKIQAPKYKLHDNNNNNDAKKQKQCYLYTLYISTHHLHILYKLMHNVLAFFKITKLS